MKFEQTVKNSKAILAEGAVIERLNRNAAVQLDPHIVHAGLIYTESGKNVLSNIYREYLDIGRRHKLPIIVLAPTWRANPERIGKSIFKTYENINADCVSFIHEIRNDYSNYSEDIYIGGLMACRGDAYRPQEALSQTDAKSFHQYQAYALAQANVDFIMAATLPAVSEAIGLADALSDCGVPYIVSFVITRNGAVLDGTPLHEAVEKIDSRIDPKPLCYAVNCVHPAVFEHGIAQEINHSKWIENRLLGFQANTSSKSPEELDGLDYLDTTAPAEFAESMLVLHQNFGIRILGGCCGTDHRHIEEIANLIYNQYKPGLTIED
ncbi:MAG: homocysteine S-methyltransferase family protein [Desulfobacterales bacterium]|jgi:S-methylmethionine-dependent homocysteine/selenocysteine methylase